MSLRGDFRVGCAVYPAMELLARGRTHWTMALAGGISAAWLGRLARMRGPLLRRALWGGLGITAIEYAIGRRFNRRYRVWDYRRMPLNVRGQVCLPYTALWCALSTAVLTVVRE